MQMGDDDVQNNHDHDNVDSVPGITSDNWK